MFIDLTRLFKSEYNLIKDFREKKFDLKKTKHL